MSWQDKIRIILEEKMLRWRNYIPCTQHILQNQVLPLGYENIDPIEIFKYFHYKVYDKMAGGRNYYDLVSDL